MPDSEFVALFGAGLLRDPKSTYLHCVIGWQGDMHGALPRQAQMRGRAHLDEQVAAVDRALKALRQAADRAAQLLGLGAAHGAAPLCVQPRGIEARALLHPAGGVLRRRQAWMQCQ